MQMATAIGTMTVPPQTAVMTTATVPPVAKPSIPSMPPPEAARPTPGPIRRQSGLPVPVRPSTPLPLRVQTPTTPVRTVGRGNGSAESTLLSSVHSTFSVASVASSFSSVEGEGGSPVVEREKGDEKEKGGERVKGARREVVPQYGMIGMTRTERIEKRDKRGRERERELLGDVGRETGERDRTVVMTWAERARGMVGA